MDTITPDDLAMYRKARERFEWTKQQALQAQQAFAQAQQAHIAAAGWLEGAVETIRTRPGFPEGGSFHPETGAITVASPASPGAQAVSGPRGIDNQATTDRFRKSRVK